MEVSCNKSVDQRLREPLTLQVPGGEYGDRAYRSYIELYSLILCYKDRQVTWGLKLWVFRCQTSTVKGPRCQVYPVVLGFRV